jgi:haloalkane dehalogenase
MGVLRTPDERFDGLPDYPFPRNYVQVQTKGVDSLRMYYVDAGPSDGPVVLLMHGQPTWSYVPADDRCTPRRRIARRRA